jgi:hypothetical protein
MRAAIPSSYCVPLTENGKTDPRSFEWKALHGVRRRGEHLQHVSVKLSRTPRLRRDAAIAPAHSLDSWKYASPTIAKWRRCTSFRSTGAISLTPCITTEYICTFTIPDYTHKLYNQMNPIFSCPALLTSSRVCRKFPVGKADRIQEYRRGTRGIMQPICLRKKAGSMAIAYVRGLSVGALQFYTSCRRRRHLLIPERPIQVKFGDSGGARQRRSNRTGSPGRHVARVQPHTF